MKVVMFYEVAQDGIAKAQANFAGHRARLDEFHARRVLLAELGIVGRREEEGQYVEDQSMSSQSASRRGSCRLRVRRVDGRPSRYCRRCKPRLGWGVARISQSPWRSGRSTPHVHV